MNTQKRIIFAFGLLALSIMVLGSLQVVNTASANSSVEKGTVVAYTVQSAHNYANNYDYTWTVTKTGASQMRVFFYEYQVETNYDYIYIMDKNSVVKQTLTSSTAKFSVWSSWITGDTVKLRLKTDSSVVYYGFKVTQYEYETSGGGDTDGGALTNGVAKAGTLPAGDQSDMFYIDVAASAQSMYVALTCGSYDFDDYGKFNAEPTTSSYDWRGYTSGGEENTVTSPAQGRHYIMVNKYSGDGAYSLTATITYGGGDTTAPTVSVTAPTNGATVSGTTTISASASDNVGVSSVEFYIDSALVNTDTSSPYSYSWSTTSYSNGAHSIYAKAKDAANNVGTSSTISVTVSNSVADTTAPTVSITAPTSGATVSGTTTISASASDNVGVTSVEFYVDSVLKGTDTSSPYSYSWDTTAYSNAAHTIYAKAKDAANNVGTSSTISVTVSNSAGSVLTSGVPVSGSLSAVGATATWTITVPASTSSMYSVLTCGTSDFDLYGKLGSAPTTSVYDWRGYTSGGEEVTFSNPGAGTWYIMVNVYSGSGSYQLTVTLTTGGGGTGWGTGGKYAIIVGISDYASINDLSFCDEDATDWYNFMVSKGYECHVYGDGHTANFPRHDGTATEATVRAAIQALATHAVSGDEVAFITSGHGSGDGAGSSYLCMYDCSGSTGCYYDTEIAADLDNFVSGVNIFVFIDHCYSGGIGPELMNMPNKAYVYCTTTCTANGYGYDDPDHSNGAWTYYFMEAQWQPNPSRSAEANYDVAQPTYPHTGGDACMEFDGNTSAAFYI
jgi:hypothetical protein